MLKKDIRFLLSGGPDNANINMSVGGLPSKHTIANGVNNLFDNLTGKQSSAGYTDYRCFYVSNDNADEKFKNIKMFVHKALGGSNIKIGLTLVDEVQSLTVKGRPINGNFQLIYIIKHGQNTFLNTTRDINWVPDAVQMSQRIAAILNSLDQLQGIQVVGSENDDGFDFLITFAGASGGRGQELLGVVNQLGVNVVIARVSKGGPINSVAPNVGEVNNPPSDVKFAQSDRNSPIQVGTLFPNDVMPVWIMRTVGSNTKPIHPDQFEFIMFGEPVSANLRVKKHSFDITKNGQPVNKSQNMYF